MSDDPGKAQDVFRRALAAVGVEAASAALFEDSARNCVGAKRCGLHTVLLDGATRAQEGNGLQGIDVVLQQLSLEAVRKHAPHLLQERSR